MRPNIFKDTTFAKKLAKDLNAALRAEGVNALLSDAQTATAQGLGHADWHALERSCAPSADAESPPGFREEVQKTLAARLQEGFELDTEKAWRVVRTALPTHDDLMERKTASLTDELCSRGLPASRRRIVSMSLMKALATPVGAEAEVMTADSAGIARAAFNVGHWYHGRDFASAGPGRDGFMEAIAAGDAATAAYTDLTLRLFGRDAPPVFTDGPWAVRAPGPVDQVRRASIVADLVERSGRCEDAFMALANPFPGAPPFYGKPGQMIAAAIKAFAEDPDAPREAVNDVLAGAMDRAFMVVRRTAARIVARRGGDADLDGKLEEGARWVEDPAIALVYEGRLGAARFAALRAGRAAA